MDYLIVSGKYEKGNEEQKLGFIQLWGDEDIQGIFDLYFHWFNLIHELGHALLRFQGIEMNSVEEEVFVNCFAVQYWKSVDKTGRIDEINKISSKVVSRLSSVLPADVDFYSFYNALWETEDMFKTMVYGPFQMLCTQKAFGSTKSLETLLGEIGYQGLNFEALRLQEVDLAITEPTQIIEGCLENLKSIGCKTPVIGFEYSDNPEHQYCQWL